MSNLEWLPEKELPDSAYTNSESYATYEKKYHFSFLKKTKYSFKHHRSFVMFNLEARYFVIYSWFK